MLGHRPQGVVPDTQGLGPGPSVSTGLSGSPGEGAAAGTGDLHRLSTVQKNQKGEGGGGFSGEREEPAGCLWVLPERHPAGCGGEGSGERPT